MNKNRQKNIPGIIECNLNKIIKPCSRLVCGTDSSTVRG